MDANLEKNELVELTAEIVSAYVSNNTVVATDLPAVIHNVFDALSKASSASGIPVKEELKPAVAAEEVGHARVHHLPRGREEVQVAEAASAHPLRPVSGRISGEMGITP